MRYSDASTEAAYFHLARESIDPSVIAQFTLDGEPVSKARARFTGYGSKARAYTPAKTQQAESQVRAAFMKVAPRHRFDPEMTYGLTAIFFNGTRQRRDIDNMLKLLLDGLNGVAWHDDANVVEVSGRKCIEEKAHARTEVIVYQLGPVQRLQATCAGCGEQFPSFPSDRRRYCSLACGNKSKVKVRPPCLRCGEPIKTLGAKYCSRTCMGHDRRKATRSGTSSAPTSAATPNADPTASPSTSRT